MSYYSLSNSTDPPVPQNAGVPVLEGRSNFKAWSRDFQGIAKFKKLWKLVDGTEAILPEPTATTSPDAVAKYDKQQQRIGDIQ